MPSKEKMPLIDEQQIDDWWDRHCSDGDAPQYYLKLPISQRRALTQRDADQLWHDEKMRELADKNKILEKRVEHLKGDLYLCAGAIETLEAKEREWARKLLAHEQGVETGNTTYLVFTNEEIAKLRKEAK